MNKRIWLMAGIIILLAAGVAVFALLNAQTLPNSGSETVTVTDNEQTKTFDIEYLKGLPKTTFSADLNTNGQDPVEKFFGGVPLIDVLKSMEFNLSSASQVVFKAADGYSTVVTAEEAADTENVYVVYERDGKPSGTMAQGGTGPIEIVIKKDTFSQRWCKFLQQIDIE